jgi:hypothetical protein
VAVTVELREAPYAGWRALAATVLVIVTAIGAHGWAGGGVPDWPTLALLAGVLFGCGMLFLRGGFSLRVLLPVVALAQVMSHGAFATLAPHDHHAGAGSTGLLSAASPWSWQMLLAHAVATVVAAVVWRWCERTAEVVLGHRAHWLARPAGPSRVPIAHVFDRIGYVVCLVSAPRRGPPAVVRTAS